MLVLRQGLTADNIVVTLAEKIILPVPYFVFVFTHVTTKQVVTYLPALIDDISIAKQRYNEFIIPMSLFAGKAPGQWQYKIFEATTSTPITTGLNLLENGKMVLVDAKTVSLIGYNSITTMSGYMPA